MPGKIEIAGMPVAKLSDQQLGYYLKDLAKAAGFGLINKIRDRWVAIYRWIDDVGPPFSIRGAFYGMSTRQKVPKTEAGYLKVQHQLFKLRRFGIMPYEWITDGTRWPRIPRAYDSPQEALAETAEYFRRKMWTPQSDYLEIWCEKNALNGIIYPVTAPYVVPLMPSGGFSSETFLHDSAEEIRKKVDQGKNCHVYVLTDLDKAGDDMLKQIQEGFEWFGVQVEIHRLALTTAQVDQYGIQAAARKSKDEGFIGYHGQAVELDALPPDQLRALIRGTIESHIDWDVWKQTLIEQAGQKANLLRLADEGIYEAEDEDDTNDTSPIFEDDLEEEQE
jgi:hypothetical protein